MTAHKEQPVYGERIKEAREIRGFSQSVLAELVQVKRQSISAFEKDKIKPSVDTLFNISSVTGFPVPFFLNVRPRSDSIRTAPISFRKKAIATKTAVLQAQQWENIFADIYYYLEHYLDFAPHKVPFYNELDYQELKDVHVEKIATEVRRAWSLGDGPISNMTRLLENNGIFIASIDLPITMDAFSTWRYNRPFILLSDGNKSCVRRRFNEAHELGHLVLHSMVDEADFKNPELSKKLESQANRFAGAFLFPLKSVNNEYFSNSIKALTSLKGRWKISIAAIAKRLRDLGLISIDQYKYVMIQLGGNRKKEPLDDKISMEEPAMIQRAFSALLKNNLLLIRHAVDDLMIPDMIFSKLTGIELEKPSDNDETIIPFLLKQ
jgi:Zn-dependent peptidase ImmA (M78 family)/transcriptional regulator with XRE-family HTH domain